MILNSDDLTKLRTQYSKQVLKEHVIDVLNLLDTVEMLLSKSKTATDVVTTFPISGDPTHDHRSNWTPSK